MILTSALIRKLKRVNLRPRFVNVGSIYGSLLGFAGYTSFIARPSLQCGGSRRLYGVSWLTQRFWCFMAGGPRATKTSMVYICCPTINASDGGKEDSPEFVRRILFKPFSRINKIFIWVGQSECFVLINSIVCCI